MAAIAISSFGLAACHPMSYQDFSDKRTESVQLTEVHIEGDAGNVTLRRDASLSQATIARHFQYNGARPASNGWDSTSGTVLTLNTACGVSCAVSYTVTLPWTVTVTGHLDSGGIDLLGIAAATLKTNSGGITVHDAAGDVNAGTDSGGMTVTDVHGRLNLQGQSGSATVKRVTGATTVSTDSGSVRAEGLSGTQTSVRTQSGSVTINLSTAQDLTAETDSGSLRVSVPSGSYRLTQSTDSGHVSVGVPVDNVNGKYGLHLKTQSGSITLSPA